MYGIFRSTISRLAGESRCFDLPQLTLHAFSKRHFTTSFQPHVQCETEESSELFGYTSGRWLWNDASKHAERRRPFNVSGLKQLAASAVNRSIDDVTGFKKLGEGDFNRTFLITMRDGFQLVGRIPYLSLQPRHLAVASEVATMNFLRMNGISVPKIYGHSTTSENPAGTEYMFMDLVPGTKLGDIWFDLPKRARFEVITQIVRLEAKLFALQFPASGSLYYTKDLDVNTRRTEVPTAGSSSEETFCVGPDTRLSLWYGRRSSLDLDRGPFTDPAAALVAGAKKETAYLEQFGRPLHPFQRLRREVHGYQKVSPTEHLHDLENFLKAAPHIVPKDSTLVRPILRHPDLHPNNVFVSDDLEVTGLIDWQHCAILPLFLQCGIPNTFQNYGDSVSENLETPQLPPNFDQLSEQEQYDQVMLLHRRRLHWYYVAATIKHNPVHRSALSHDFSTLRLKLFASSGSPWEGDNVTLKTDLIDLQRKWSSVTDPSNTTHGNAPPYCPFNFSEDEVKECLRLHAAQKEADNLLQACRDVVGVGFEGWMPLDEYDETKQREQKLKLGALEAADTGYERQMLQEHWIFDDFDEEEYT